MFLFHYSFVVKIICMYVLLSEKFYDEIRRHAKRKSHKKSTCPETIEPYVDPYFQNVPSWHILCCAPFAHPWRKAKMCHVGTFFLVFLLVNTAHILLFLCQVPFSFSFLFFSTLLCIYNSITL